MELIYKGFRILDHDKQADDWKPTDLEDFEFSVDFYVGGTGTADAFTVRVCSLKWFNRELGNQVIAGEGFLFMPRFDRTTLSAFLETYFDNVVAKTWEAFALKLNGLGKWEYGYTA